MVNLADRIDAHLRQVGSSTAREIADALGVPKSTLHRALTGMVSSARIARQLGEKALRFTIADQDYERRTGSLAPRLVAGLGLVKTTGPITRSGYAERMGVSIRTASRDLAELLGSGSVERVGGRGRIACYVAAKKAPGTGGGGAGSG